MPQGNGGDLFFRLLDPVERRGLGQPQLPRNPLRHQLAEFLLFRPLPRDELRIEQPRQNPLPRLAAVLHAKQVAHGLPFFLWPLVGIGIEHHLEPVERGERKRYLPVSHGEQFAERAAAIGVAGVTRHKHEIARGNRLPAPREVVRHPCWLAILIGPEETDVEVVAGKLEVVGIAAEECDLLLGREDEPHVGIFLGSVKMVEATLMERDHVAPQAGGGERLLLDLRHHLAAGSKRVGRRHPQRNGRLHAGGDILDRDEHVEFKVVALEFVGLGGRREAVAIIVVLRVAEFLQAIGPDMVVGEHEAVGRHK